jgi:hypothetical protein
VDYGLDACEDYGWIAAMKMTMLVALLGGLVLISGCVSTVNDRHAFALSPAKDRIESRYDRPVDQVFAAATEVVKDMGALIREGTLYPEQTKVVKTVEGKVNQRNVWIRIESVDPKITSVIVQARTSAGGTDLELAAQIKERIAIALTAGK